MLVCVCLMMVAGAKIVVDSISGLNSEGIICSFIVLYPIYDRSSIILEF